MKVRISGNSIRFRLKQSEVKQFHETGEIEEEIIFGSEATEKLSFFLKKGDGSNFELSYMQNLVTVNVPLLICDEWTQTTLVGFEEIINTGKGEIIKVLVEKDFACLDGSDVENEDAFTNPNFHC